MILLLLASVGISCLLQQWDDAISIFAVCIYKIVLSSVYTDGITHYLVGSLSFLDLLTTDRR